MCSNPPPPHHRLPLLFSGGEDQSLQQVKKRIQTRTRAPYKLGLTCRWSQNRTGGAVSFQQLPTGFRGWGTRKADRASLCS